MTPPLFHPRSSLVIRNPVSGRFFSRRRAAKLERILRKRGYTVVHTQQPEHATEIARDFAHREGHSLILIGGDGTVMEAVQALPQKTAIAVFPTGTVNLLARALGIPTKIRDWLPLLERGALRDAYGATCNGKRFLSVGSAGLTAQAVERVHPGLKRVLQEVAYGISAFLGYFRYRNPKWDVRLDDEPIETPILGLVMGLGPHYGGPRTIFPAADVAQPQIEVCLLTGKHKILLWQYVFGMLTGTLSRMRRLEYRRATRIHVTCDPAMSVELDGDFYGYTPIDIRVDSLPRPFLVPNPEADAAATTATTV